MFAMEMDVSKCIIGIRNGRRHPSIIPQGNVDYQSKLSSAILSCRLACTHSSIVQRDTS
jgi:hypothetical protein